MFGFLKDKVPWSILFLCIRIPRRSCSIAVGTSGYSFNHQLLFPQIKKLQSFVTRDLEGLERETERMAEKLGLLLLFVKNPAEFVM